MSVFRVGQRVRILYSPSGLTGKTGVVWNVDESPSWGEKARALGITGRGYDIDVDGIGRRHREGPLITFPPYYLAPLTDPSADAFIARIKKLGREPVNSPEKVTV